MFYVFFDSFGVFFVFSWPHFFIGNGFYVVHMCFHYVDFFLCFLGGIKEWF